MNLWLKYHLYKRTLFPTTCLFFSVTVEKAFENDFFKYRIQVPTRPNNNPLRCDLEGGTATCEEIRVSTSRPNFFIYFMKYH